MACPWSESSRCHRFSSGRSTRSSRSCRDAENATASRTMWFRIRASRSSRRSSRALREDRRVMKRTPLTYALLVIMTLAGSSTLTRTSTADDFTRRAIERRAIEAVIWGMPAVSFDLMLQAFVGTKGAPNQVAYWSRLIDWKNQTLTPNPDTIYVMPFYDTKDGPVVLEIRGQPAMDRSPAASTGADGLTTVQFGGCDGKIPNCIPIVEGWNYTVRLYRPRPEILSGKWKFPEA